MQLLTAGTRDVTALLFSPAGDALVGACRYTLPLLWPLPAADPVRLPVPGNYVHSTAFTFSADGNVLGWVSNGKRNEFDRAAGAVRTVELTPGNEHVTAQAVCGPDGRLVVRTVGRAHAFAADGRGGWSPLWAVQPSDWAVGQIMAGSPRSDRFFTWEVSRNGYGPRRLAARSAVTGADVAHTPVTFHYLLGMAMHPEGDAVVVFKDSSLHVWAPGGRVEKVRTGTLKHYNALAYHPDGRHLLAGNNDATARLIDTRTWQVVRQYAWDVGKLTAVAVSPDGVLAAAGGQKGQIVVWDLDV